MCVYVCVHSRLCQIYGPVDSPHFRGEVGEGKRGGTEEGYSVFAVMNLGRIVTESHSSHQLYGAVFSFQFSVFLLCIF